MTSFTSLLSSIGGGPPKAPQPKTTGASNPAAPGTTRPSIQPPTARPTSSNMVAGVKRKQDDLVEPTQSKTVRTEVKVPVRPLANPSPSTAKPVPSAMSPSSGYRGTARPSGSGSTTQQVKPGLKVAATAARPSPAAAATPASPAATAAAKPKRGFAAIMEKAKAAEEAAKAAGTSTIRHKTVEKMSRRERERAQQAAAAAAAGSQKPGVKGGKAAVLADRSRSGTPNDGRPGLQKKASEIGYKGTMKPAPPKPEIAYKGTMRKSVPGEQVAKKAAAAKGQAQDKYGGYASWSDLSAAEDDEEDYDSDGSSMMEAGLDDVEAEETMALRAAKREDKEALEEEERLKREKLERKKKLMALNKSAAARKKY